MALGYLGLAQGVPLVLFQLYGGVLADRIDRLRLLLVTQILTALALTAAFILAVLGQVRLPHLLVLAVLSNTFRAFDEPSRLSLIPQLVDRARLSNAIALGSIPWQAGRMIGPSIAGILIAAFGGAVGFAMAAGASYIALIHKDADSASRATRRPATAITCCSSSSKASASSRTTSCSPASSAWRCSTACSACRT